MKLYAVTDGYYSNYQIITLQRDKQRAENIAKMFGEDARVEEFDEDKLNDDFRWWKYEVIDGEEPEIAKYSFSLGREKVEVYETCKWTRKPHRKGEYIERTAYRVHLRADTKEQAAKIAQDMIAELKARKAGLTE